MPAASGGGGTGGTSGGSWVAGSGSFGLKNQPGGIWRENAPGSMGTPKKAPTQGPAAEGLVPAALPGLPTEVPATVSVPGRARSGGILASRSLAGAHPASGAGFGASRTGGSRSVGSKTASLGAHRHAGTQSHAGSSRGSGAGSSSSHGKSQPPSVFAPSSSSARGGMHQPGSGRGTIP
jgi:hypothetical protein